MTHPHLSKRTFIFIQNTTKTKIIFTFNLILQGLVVEDEESENHLEEVEAEKSILQISSSQLLYKICENGSC